ncbi:hypothetical protein ACHAXS_006712 [Conticribra weissflogii]
MKISLVVATAVSIVSTVKGFAPSPQSKATTSLSFFGGGTKKAAPSSALTDEALQIYLDKYPVKNGSGQKFFFDSWGMPESYQTTGESKALFNFDDTKLRATFNAIAQLYGEENALKMVKIQPGILAFKKENFKQSLENFGEIFGYDEAKDMVLRNPGLLSVNPANAAAADKLTMQLSYVVEFTRPVGKAGPFVLLSLLSVPVIEGSLGLSRGELIASLFN